MNKGYNDFDYEFLVNGLKELNPVIFYKDIEGRYVFSNHHKEHTIFDDGHCWDIYGKTDLECRNDIENAKYVHGVDLEILKTGNKTNYVIEKPHDGEIRYLEIQKSPVYKNKEIVGIVGLIVDITEKELLKKELERTANTDQLTGLYNRNYFCNWKKNKNKESIYPLTLISADCNHLKHINDTYGHAKGDKYIKMMSFLFNETLPESSVKFRMGGDEFLIILLNTTKEEGLELIDKLNKNGKEYKIMDNELSASYGLTTIEQYTENFDKYLNQADRNMYKEKEKNHNLEKLRFFVK